MASRHASMADIRSRKTSGMMLVVLATAFVTPWTTAFMSSDALALHSRVAVAGTVRTGKPLTKLDVRSLRTTVANDGCGFWCEKTKQRRGSLSTADPSSAGDWSYKSVTRSRLATVGGDVDGMTRRVCEVKPAYTIVITMGSARGWGGITSWLPWRGKAKATTTPAPQGLEANVVEGGWLNLGFATTEGRLATDSSGGGGGGGNGGRGGGGGGDDGGSRGGWRSRRGSGGGQAVAASNGTASGGIYVSNSNALDSSIEVDESLMQRSPLVRTFAPVVNFFRARAGLYCMMLGYVMFTVSQHITPVYLGISFLTVIGLNPARRILVATTQGLSLLTVACYIQDQFRHQVYPLPAVVSGPSAPYAVISGGSSGIGREIANELAARGYNLLLVSRGKEGLERAAKEIREASREAVVQAKKEREGDGGETSKRETREERRRRRREEREERKRLAARIAAQGAKGHNSDQHTNSQSIEHAGEDTGQGWASGSGMGRGVLGEHAASDRDVLPTPPPSPILADAVTVRWLQADLANSTAPAAVHNEVHRLNITVEILVNAAGVCRRGRVETLESRDMEDQLNLNVVGTSLLSRLFAKDFAKRRRGRVMIVSSVTAAAPNPTVAAYAASKAYLSSFAEALHSELEIFGVGVTCVMPGATTTNFEENSGSAKALMWRLPLVSMEADEVAARAVEALMRGDRIIVPGWQNKIYVHVMAPVLPRKILMSFLEALWR